MIIIGKLSAKQKTEYLSYPNRKFYVGSDDVLVVIYGCHTYD